MNEHASRPDIALRPAAPGRFFVLSAVVWLAALYALCRPYRGVRHDAQIYFAQAQYHLTPGWLSHDLFLQFGSQDRYSIFSHLFAPLLQALGLQQAEIASLLALHLFFWVASWALVRGAEPGLRWAMLGTVAVLPHFYGATQTFSFEEPFLTARTLAEPFCVLGLAALASRRHRWAGVALVLALVSHPLIALPVWAMAWVLMCREDRRWIWAGVALLGAVVVAGAAGVPPFNGLFQRFDPAWLDQVERTSGYNFFATWTKESISLALFDLALLAFAARDRGSPLRTLCQAALVVVVASFVLEGVLVEGLKLVLPTQVQLWRSQWVAHYLALLVLLPSCRRLWRMSEAGRLAAAMVVAAALMVSTAADTSWLFALAAVVVSVLALRGATITRRIANLGIAVCILGAVVMAAILALHDLMIVVWNLHSGVAFGRVESIPSAIPELMLLVVWGALVWPAATRRRWLPAASLVAGALALAFGTFTWDQRDSWSRYVESHYGASNPFGLDLAPDAQVYWPDEMMATWVLLQRPAYASLAAAAGAVYGRPSALELHRRRDIVRPMTAQIDGCIELAREGRTDYSPEQCKYTDVAIRDVCRSPGAPDDVVLMNPLQAPPLAVWNYQPPGRPAEPYYLYDCHRF